jgi:hypothetical protein
MRKVGSTELILKPFPEIDGIINEEMLVAVVGGLERE